MQKPGLGIAKWQTIAVTALGITTPIAWDHYRSRSSVEVQQLATSVVVDNVDRLEKLKFTYDGQPVARISKMDLAVTNSGRTPIRDADVVSPLEVVVGPECQVLDVRIQKVMPQDLVLTAAITPNRGGVTFRFPLLNPGDRADTSLLVAGPTKGISIRGRISGVRRVPLEDRRPEMLSIWRRVPWTVWLVGAFTAFGLIMTLLVLPMLGTELAIRDLWRAGALAVTASTAGEYLKGLCRLGDAKDEELESVRAHLVALPPDQELTADDRKEVDTAIAKAVTNMRSMWVALGVISGLTLIGIIYLVSAVT